MSHSVINSIEVEVLKVEMKISSESYRYKSKEAMDNIPKIRQ